MQSRSRRSAAAWRTPEPGLTGIRQDDASRPLQTYPAANFPASAAYRDNQVVDVEHAPQAKIPSTDVMKESFTTAPCDGSIATPRIRKLVLRDQSDGQEQRIAGDEAFRIGYRRAVLPTEATRIPSRRPLPTISVTVVFKKRGMP